jgi:hypothetical protein
VKTITAIIMAAFTASTAYAGNPNCNTLAKESKLSSEAKLNFIKECNSGQVQAREEKPVTRSHQVGNANKSASTRCQTLDRCGDLSTQLEATAAGLGGDAGANSGHSYVRVKRVSQ